MRRLLAAAILAFMVVVYFGPMLKGQPQTPPASAGPSTVVVPGNIPPVGPGIASQPAVAVTTVPSPASPDNVQDQILWAGAMSFALRFLLKKKWIAVTTERAKVALGALTAIGTAAGIHFAVAGSFLDGHGLTLTVSGVSWDVFKDIGFQWLAQQTWYEAVVKNGKLNVGNITNILNGGQA